MCRILTTLAICFAWGVLSLAAPLSAQDPAEVKLKKLADDSRARAEAIEVNVTVGNRARKAAVHLEPLMKYTDVPRTIEMATLWVWQDEGHPVALGKVEAYGRKEGTKWLYCFASTAEALVEAKWPDGRLFQAKKPGIEWSAVKGPTPQATVAGRRRQLKELFERFFATARNDALKSSDELRPLARPLHEYFSPKRGVTQGILCGFAANGTNPDVIVALEAVGAENDKDPPKSWRYGVIRMTTSAVSIKLDKDEVYKRDFVKTLGDRDDWTHFWEQVPKK
jgi:hypothetical protein